MSHGSHFLPFLSTKMANLGHKFTLEEDLSICRNFVICFPKRGEGIRHRGVASNSFWEKIHENFCNETGNVDNLDQLPLFIRFEKIRERVVEFLIVYRRVSRNRLRDESYEECVVMTKNEWRRWKGKDFKYEDHFRILRDFFILRFGY